MPRTHTELDTGSLIALHRHQRRLLRVGGVVLTLVIVLAGIAAAWSTLDNYHRAQRETFVDAESEVDGSLARMAQEHWDDLRTFKALWRSQRAYLLSVGAPLGERFVRQGHQIVVQADAT